jgi:hypothetical protein
MGGYWGEVRGRRKIDCYLAYVQEAETWELDHNPDPKNKKFCKQEMQWDRRTGEWFLKYRFSK